jgi:hypothetical protein
VNGYPTNLSYGKSEGELVSGPLRIFLRFLGFAMLAVGLAFLGAFVFAGPNQIAEWAGQSCAYGSGLVRASESCTVWDVIEFVPMAGALVLVGAVLALVMRRPKAPASGESAVALGTWGAR